MPLPNADKTLNTSRKNMEDSPTIPDQRRVSIAHDIEIVGIPAQPIEEVDFSNSLKDSRRSWYVCFAAFMIQVLIVGVLHVFGVFFVALIEEFKCTRAEAAWIGSVAYGLTMFLGPLSSSLITRFGNRIVAALGSLICCISLIISSFMTSIPALYGSFGVLYGLGTCLAYTPTMTIAGDYFDKKLTVATGIMVAGSSTGTLILSPIAQAMLTNLGWRNSFRILSVFTLVGVWSGWMFKPLESTQPPHSPSKEIKKSMARSVMKELQLWKNKVFLIWSLAITCAMFGYYVPYVHLVSHAADLNIPPEKGSILLMLLGATTAVGRVMFGKIVELGFLNRLHMHQLSMVITGTACMILPLITTFYGLILYVILVGLVDGCFVVLLPVLTSSLFGSENKVTAWGFLIGVSSITFTLGPPVAGWLYDAYGSYNLAFHVAGIPIIIGAIMLLFIPWAQRTFTSTNVMTAARSSYATNLYGDKGMFQEDHDADDDVHGDESVDGVPLNLFAITSDESQIKSDEGILRASTSSSEHVIQQQNSKPYLVVDVTDAVRQKVEEAFELYHQHSADVQAIREGPLSHLGTPTFVIGSSQHSVQSSSTARYIVGSPAERGSIAIKLAMSPGLTDTASTSAPRVIIPSRGSRYTPASSVTSDMTSIQELRRRMHTPSHSPGSAPRVVVASSKPRGSDVVVLAKSVSQRTAMVKGTEPTRRRLLSDSVTQTDESLTRDTRSTSASMHALDGLLGLFDETTTSRLPHNSIMTHPAAVVSPPPAPPPPPPPPPPPRPAAFDTQIHLAVDSNDDFVHVQPPSEEHHVTSSSDVTPVNTPRRSGAEAEPIFQMSDISLTEQREHRNNHF